MDTTIAFRNPFTKGEAQPETMYLEICVLGGDGTAGEEAHEIGM